MFLFNPKHLTLDWLDKVWLSGYLLSFLYEYFDYSSKNGFIQIETKFKELLC